MTNPKAVFGVVILAVTVHACAGQRSQPIGPVPAAPVVTLRAELDEILVDPAFHNANWGVMVQSVETGEVLYRKHERKLFMPASNMKLVTGAVALTQLGADHHFLTRVLACGEIDRDGVLQGDVVVIGGGDPTISQRFGDGDPRHIFRAWSDSLQSRGIRRIEGNVVGDDDLFDDVHIGPGWAWDNLGSAYAAEIGALLFNEGALRINVTPGRFLDSSAAVSVEPPTSFVDLRGEVSTVGDSTGITLGVARPPFSNQAAVKGAIWIGADSVTLYIAPHDPTLYFVTVLRETLEAQGVEVVGRAVDRDRDSAAGDCDLSETLFVHESQKLAEILRPLFKESQNQVAEMLLRYLGAVSTDTGSVATGRRVVTQRLTNWGIPDDSYIYFDGSGLSRYNYLAPEALVRLLRTMSQRDDFEVFYDALPIAGVDGTLEGRMRGTRAEGNARAKTGFISNARALSGYVTTQDGELLAFSIIANNFDTPVRPVEFVQDLIVERLASFRRGSIP
jgi:D-alanyl-D-alanine carboxypeptidase/D-alanyl-D-alanine-endopeptidase (penicillin-binding protein 4)